MWQLNIYVEIEYIVPTLGEWMYVRGFLSALWHWVGECTYLEIYICIGYMMPTIWGVYVTWRYMLILDISCQHLEDECKLEGFCVPFRHRVWKCTFKKNILLIHTIKTSVARTCGHPVWVFLPNQGGIMSHQYMWHENDTIQTCVARTRGHAVRVWPPAP